MILKLCYKEGRDERCTETDLSTAKTLVDMQAFILEAIRDAYKYSTEPIPEGLDINRDHKA